LAIWLLQQQLQQQSPVGGNVAINSLMDLLPAADVDVAGGPTAPQSQTVKYSKI